MNPKPHNNGRFEEVLLLKISIAVLSVRVCDSTCVVSIRGKSNVMGCAQTKTFFPKMSSLDGCDL